QDLVLPTIL
ncbi:unnamed protein product, partial [Rotaria sordida]